MHVRTPGAGTGTAASPQVSRPLAAFSLSASASPDRNCCRIICVGNFPRCPGRMVASRVFFHCLRCSCSSSYAEGCRGHVLAQAPPDPAPPPPANVAPRRRPPPAARPACLLHGGEHSPRPFHPWAPVHRFSLCSVRAGMLLSCHESGIT